jgi:hypothetical protein
VRLQHDLAYWEAEGEALFKEGKALLDGYNDARQQYHAGLVKPRELGHDVQLYRMYQMEAARLEKDGAGITRVVLDYELKRDYQTFLHRKDRPEGATQESDLQAFAAARQLPIIDGHLELPDLRIEYETEDGRAEHRDDRVADELLDDPAFGLDLPAHRREERIKDVAQPLGVELLAQRRRAGDVGEQDRHPLPLLAG